MMPLEMLEKIRGECKGVRLVGWLSVHHKTDDYCWNVYPGSEMDNTCALASGKTPEAVIEAAHKKLFPPILKQIKNWHWNSELGAWELWVAGLPYCYILYDVVHYGERYILRPSLRLQEQGTDHVSLNKTTVPALADIVNENPKLKPPTEK